MYALIGVGIMEYHVMMIQNLPETGVLYDCFLVFGRT